MIYVQYFLSLLDVLLIHGEKPLSHPLRLPSGAHR